MSINFFCTIFKRKGYQRVFSDVSNEGNPYEDWYVHPELVDMKHIGLLIEKNKDNYEMMSLKKKDEFNYSGKKAILHLDWKKIKYNL